MRRLLFTLLALAVVAPTAAYAAHKAVGDGVLELKAVYGAVVVGTYKEPATGVLWGQMDKGRLTIVDPVAGDGSIFVTGWDKPPKVIDPTATDGTPRVVVYQGTNLRFRVSGGKYRLVFNGSGIDLTAVGMGTAFLNGDVDALDAGYYAVDSGKWLPVPVYVSPKSALKVPFGGLTAQTP